MNGYRLAADGVLILHACFVSFVVLGLVVIWLGIALKWEWIRSPWFRLAHLLAIGMVVAQSVIGMTCPLTTWESHLRVSAGQTAYGPAGCIEYWLHRMIFFTAPTWVFTVCYVTFGLAVLGTMLLAPRAGRGGDIRGGIRGSTNMRFELIEGEATDLRPAMANPLRTYNRAQNPVFFAAVEDPANVKRDFHIVLYDDAGEIAGGLIGDTQFAWLHVEILSVREDLRRRGVGTKLMRQAEAEARRRGCKYVYVDTMSYQAPEFYSKLGYQTVAEIPDWDSHGHTKYAFALVL